MAKKIPLITLCIQKYSHLSEAEIRSRIIQGQVYVNGEKRIKPGELVDYAAQLEILVKNNFFSRGALKLAPVLDELELDIQGFRFIDAGASTGGFTQCLLQRGAARVYAVDVGYNQLAYSLRCHQRVVVWERRNIMDLRHGDFESRPDGAVCDLSFRSISGAAGHILSLCKEGAWLLALIKPQFEWKTPDENFKGVIFDKEVIKEVLLQTSRLLNNEALQLVKAIESPQKGTKGNQEYFFLLKSGVQDFMVAEEIILNLFR
ncbi:MAG: TlyA family RNA methyltransferase [Spirochaetales bacterium]|nr:TlyA family RNA methyltransferase [Spirochaetales bacterium]